MREVVRNEEPSRKILLQWMSTECVSKPNKEDELVHVSICTPGGGTGTAEVDQVPSTCPICHQHGTPKLLGAGVQSVRDEEGFIVLHLPFYCPNAECLSMYIGVYSSGALEDTLPKRPSDPDVPAQVREMSPTFAITYQQAFAAETFGLDQIAGGGFRKALEFLVKDYCVSQDDDSLEAIEKEPLGTVIEKRVKDDDIKACAKRAAWLGNDELHYVRRWNEKDIKDLKQLIRLTVFWIAAKLATAAYLEDMNPGESS